jgi:hypothetical protein
LAARSAEAEKPPRQAGPSCRLVLDVLHEALGTGVLEFGFRDVPAAIFVNLAKLTMNGAAAD